MRIKNTAMKVPGDWEARDILKRYRGRLALGLLLIVVNRAAGFAIPGSGKFLIDDVIGQGKTSLLLPLFFLVLGAALVQAVTTFVLATLLAISAQRSIADMRKNVARRILQLPIRFFESTQSGVLISRVMVDADGLRNLVGAGFVRMVGGLMTTIASVGILFYLNWQMTSLILAVLLVFGAGISLAFQKLRPLARERNEIYARISGHLGQIISGIRIVKAYNTQRREYRKFARGIHQMLRNIVEALVALAGVRAFSTFLLGLISGLVLWMGGRAILAGHMSLGDLVTYIFLTAMAAAPMVEISEVMTQLSEALAGLDRIQEIREESSEEVGRGDGVLASMAGEIVFENVSFGYATDSLVLEGVSFTVKPGTTTALVGSSGSGKSTLIGLVMAFHRPTAGRILVDGRDLESLDLQKYRQFLGIVLQDNFLFDGTLAENIAYAKPDAEFEEILEVSRLACCDDFIRNFPEGYDTVVGERGVKLSGGQRQRVAMARAILADPAILILDEATSNLDSESELMIQRALASILNGRTTLVIAHRLSTIRRADQIVVLEEGKVVEVGRHGELYQAGGRYRELYDQQHLRDKNLFLNPGEVFMTEKDIFCDFENDPQQVAPGSL